MTTIRLDASQRDFLIDCVNAGPSGLAVRPDSEGAPMMPPAVVEWSYARGVWRATATARGVEMIAALRARDRKRAS